MSFPTHAEEVLYLYNINESETTITPTPKNTILSPTPSKCRSLTKAQGLVVERYCMLILSREIPSLAFLRVVDVKILLTSNGNGPAPSNFNQ